MKQQVRKKNSSSPGSKQIPLPIGAPIKSRLIVILSYFVKYGWDLAGIFLFLISALILLGLLGLSRGLVTSALVMLVRRALGWGGYGLVLLLAGLGALAIRYKAGKPFPLRFGQFIAIEMAFFMLLPMLNFLSRATLVESEAGRGGGTLGWGFMQLLPGWFGFLFYVGIFALSSIIASGLWKSIANKILGWSQIPIPSDQSVTNNEKRISSKRSHEEPPTPKINEQLLVHKTAWRDDRLPPINLLHSERTVIPDPNQIKEKALIIEHTLAEFSLPVKVVGYRIGPTVTQYALEPGFTIKTASDGTVNKQKVRVSQIAALTRDLTLALSASRLRIETPVPGRSYVGIEVPNSDGFIVRLRPILESEEFKAKKSPLAMGLGKNVSGEPVVTDLGKMPHLLIAGTTNSGKSVCLAALITCMVMNNTPHDLRLVMLDPKMVELVRFNGIPHLLGKVETQLERMLAVLQWAQVEMDNRYRLMAEAKVRNLEGYNRKMLQKKQDTLPRIVILVDELADLMMSAPDQTEHSLIRLAQMARATGIHMIVATQRPSTDIVTGLIKANFPARIAFAVASSVDSRVILDSNGAEDLLGKGDMLFMDPTKSGLQRIQGIMISDAEVEKIISHWQKMTRGAGESSAPWENLISEVTLDASDQLIEKAIGVVKAAGKASASLLQRRLRVGYPRAARLIDELEEMGIIGPSVGSGKDRELLVDSEDNQADCKTGDY